MHAIQKRRFRDRGSKDMRTIEERHARDREDTHMIATYTSDLPIIQTHTTAHTYPIDIFRVHGQHVDEVHKYVANDGVFVPITNSKKKYTLYKTHNTVSIPHINILIVNEFSTRI